MSQKKKTAPKKAAAKAKPQPQAKIDPAKEVQSTIAPSNTPPSRGRPKQAGDMKKITLTVSHDQIIWLDRLATDIREASRVVIDRGTIIRALISALENSGIDIKHCSSEREILEIVERKLGSKE